MNRFMLIDGVTALFHSQRNTLVVVQLKQTSAALDLHTKHLSSQAINCALGTAKRSGPLRVVTQL
jgi:hypothetical protein